MNTYEKVKLIVESGKIAITKNKDGAFCLYSSLKSNGDIRCSDFGETTVKCFDYLGENSSTKTGINKEEYVGVYETTQRYPKKGDLVDILSGHLFDEDDYSCFKDMIGKGPFEIKEIIDSQLAIYNKSKDNYWYFDYRFVVPHIPKEDDEVQKAIKLLQEKGMIKDGKILSL